MTALQIATASFAVPKSVINTITGCAAPVCAGVSLPLGRVPQLAASKTQAHNATHAANARSRARAGRNRSGGELCSAQFVQRYTSAFLGITVRMPSRGFGFAFLPQKLGESIANRGHARKKSLIWRYGRLRYFSYSSEWRLSRLVSRPLMKR